MKPDPKFFFAAALAAMFAGMSAEAATTRTEYRYPDRPNIVYSSDGQVYRSNESRPMAFSKFEAAISANDAQQMMQSSGYANDVPQRLAPKPSTSSAPVYSPLPAIGAPAPQASYDFVIQAGAFGSYENAARLQRKLQAFGATRVQEGMKNGQPIYRVQLGGFQSKSEAQPMLDMIKANGYDGYVVQGS